MIATRIQFANKLNTYIDDEKLLLSMRFPNVGTYKNQQLLIYVLTPLRLRAIAMLNKQRATRNAQRATYSYIPDVHSPVANTLNVLE